VELLCGGCGRTLSVEDADAGQDVRCAYCGRRIRIPALDADEPAIVAPDVLVPMDQRENLADDFLTKARLALKKKLLVVCGACGERLTVEQRLAGKVARCPSCGEQIHIPSVGSPIETEELMAEVPARSEMLDLMDATHPGEPTPAPPPQPPHRLPPPPAETEAIPVVPRRHAPAPTPRGGNQAARVFAAAALAAAGGILVGYLIWHRIGDQHNMPQSQRVAQTPRGGKKPDPEPVRTLPTTSTPRTATAPTSRALDRKPILAVQSADIRYLAAGGTVPAPFDKAFLNVTVRITAGDKPVTIDPAAEATVTVDGETQVPSLGIVRLDEAVPIAAKNITFSIPPDESRTPTFVFAVPTDFEGGRLKVAGVGERDLANVTAPGIVAPGSLAGTYVEAARYLRIGFNDPIKEALRASVPHRLVIRPNGEAFEVAVALAGLTGQAGEVQGRTLATLTDGTHTLRCGLRLIDGGKKLVLYLAKSPYQQIIYARK